MNTESSPRVGGLLVSHAHLVRCFDLVFAASCALGCGKEQELAAWVRPPSSETRSYYLCRFNRKLCAKRAVPIASVLSCRASNVGSLGSSCAFWLRLVDCALHKRIETRGYDRVDPTSDLRTA